MAFVLDASVALAWAFADESSTYADGVLETLSRTRAIVPSLWPLEVGNVVLIGERRQRITTADVALFWQLIGSLPIIVDADPVAVVPAAVMSLARTHQLTTDDAAYLELAVRAGLPLATEDGSLRHAAASAGVPILAGRP